MINIKRIPQAIKRRALAYTKKAILLFKKPLPKYSFYGNCQLQNICRLLNASPSFCEEYAYIDIKPVHELEKGDIKQIKRVFKKLDLLIYQHVSSSFKNGSEFATDNVLTFLSDKAKSIQIPSLFFNAYFPDFHEAVIDGYGILKTNFLVNYHDFNILHGFVNGYSVDDLMRIYVNENYYEKDFCQKTLDDAFNSLREREKANGVDFLISDFIKANYKNIKLFNSQNHPKPFLIQYVIDSILKLAGANTPVKAAKTLLDGLEYHVHPSIYKHLALKFDNSTEFVTLAGVINDYKKIIELYYEEYKKIDINTLQKALSGVAKPHIAANFERLKNA